MSSRMDHRNSRSIRIASLPFTVPLLHCPATAAFLSFPRQMFFSLCNRSRDNFGYATRKQASWKIGQYELARRARCGISFKKGSLKVACFRFFLLFFSFRVNVLYLCYLLLRQLAYLPKFGLFGSQMEKRYGNSCFRAFPAYCCSLMFNRE